MGVSLAATVAVASAVAVDVGGAEVAVSVICGVGVSGGAAGAVSVG